MNIKLYFYLPSNFGHIGSRKNSGDIDVFSVNQLENNDTLMVFVTALKTY